MLAVFNIELLVTASPSETLVLLLVNVLQAFRCTGHAGDNVARRDLYTKNWFLQ
jgi:hypothetical protein